MNPQEARLIFQCGRPRGQDDHLPVMQQARGVLAAHPDLVEAMDSERQFDAILCDCLRTVDTPPGLRENILAGARITPLIPWWKRRSTWLSAAAVIAIAGGALSWNFSRGDSSLPQIVEHSPQALDLSGFREVATGKVATGGIHLVEQKPDVSQLQDYLATHSRIQHVPVPASMAKLKTVGCEVFEWNGEEVTLMCFDGGEIGTVHLFTLNAADLPDLPGDTPVFASNHGWQTMAWKAEGKVLLLAGKGTPEQLMKLVLSRPA